eukprot:scaffold39474_cov54-Phaeocystis_antarctica.AAC.2
MPRPSGQNGSCNASPTWLGVGRGLGLTRAAESEGGGHTMRGEVRAVTLALQRVAHPRDHHRRVTRAADSGAVVAVAVAAGEPRGRQHRHRAVGLLPLRKVEELQLVGHQLVLV